MTDLEVLADARSLAISDLSVTFSFNLQGRNDHIAFSRSSQTIIVKGERFYWDHRYGFHPDFDPRTFRHVLAFDGTRTSSRLDTISQLTLAAGRQWHADTQGKGFFDLALLNRPRADGNGISDQSLVSLLRCPETRLLPQLEPIGDAWCYVVQQRPPSSGGLAIKVWIDADRGMLPLRQEYHVASTTGDSLLMLFEVSEAIQAAPGLWLPVRGTKTVFPHGDLEAARVKNVWVMDVAGDEPGPPALSLNCNVQDRVFEVWKDAPPDYLVHNRDTGEAWTNPSRPAGAGVP